MEVTAIPEAKPPNVDSLGTVLMSGAVLSCVGLTMLSLAWKLANQPFAVDIRDAMLLDFRSHLYTWAIGLLALAIGRLLAWDDEARIRSRRSAWYLPEATVVAGLRLSGALRFYLAIVSITAAFYCFIDASMSSHAMLLSYATLLSRKYGAIVLWMHGASAYVLFLAPTVAVAALMLDGVKTAVRERQGSKKAD